MTQGPYQQEIESEEEFLSSRANDILVMGEDVELRSQAVDLQVRAAQYRFGYQQLWCGVPVIRLPEDILLLQEVIHEIRPSCIIETGVARGGSLLLSASLMEICGITPTVLGIDILILPHAVDAVAQSRYSRNIKLLETNSNSNESVRAIQSLIRSQPANTPALLVLDSNHSHNHVLAELRYLATLLPLGSVVVVADTLIEFMPHDFYVGRPWSKGSNPLTALQLFLSENDRFEPVTKWSRRGLISEVRDGIIRRVA